MGAPIYCATQTGMRRIDDTGSAIIIAMSLFGMLAAHVSYYVFWAWNLTTQPPGWWLLRPALALFLTPGHIVALLGCLFLAFYVAG